MSPNERGFLEKAVSGSDLRLIGKSVISLSEKNGVLSMLVNIVQIRAGFVLLARFDFIT